MWLYILVYYSIFLTVRKFLDVSCDMLELSNLINSPAHGRFVGENMPGLVMIMVLGCREVLIAPAEEFMNPQLAAQISAGLSFLPSESSSVRCLLLEIPVRGVPFSNEVI